LPAAPTPGCLPFGTIGITVTGVAIFNALEADRRNAEADRRNAEADLDECHGHTGPAPQPDGMVTSVYHDHLTGTFPTSLGCFPGVVDPMLLRRRPGG
jgi:hypothetical protein